MHSTKSEEGVGAGRRSYRRHGKCLKVEHVRLLGKEKIEALPFALDNSTAYCKMDRVEVWPLNRFALILCLIGVIGVVFLGSYEKPQKLDISTVAAIAH
jgi:hypothetical protein